MEIILYLMRLGVLFSGGKDSVYACWKAIQKDEVVCLITIRSVNPESYMFHTPNISLTSMQAEAAGIPLIEEESHGKKEEELSDLKRAIERAVQDYSIEGIVTGAVMSVYQAERVQRICNELGLWCFNPIWYTNQDQYMNNLIEEGFEVIVSGIFSEPFDEKWLGRSLSPETLEELKKIRRRYRISLTGEGGEYESSVLDAPFFRKKIRVTDWETEYSNHNGRFVVRNAALVEK
jgi:diphthine-ammonia ligase